MRMKVGAIVRAKAKTFLTIGGAFVLVLPRENEATNVPLSEAVRRLALTIGPSYGEAFFRKCGYIRSVKRRSISDGWLHPRFCKSLLLLRADRPS